MIPGPWQAAVLALGAFRIVRLIGWDDLPPVARVRAWITGQGTTVSSTAAGHLGISSDVPEITYTWRHPTLAHFIGCAYCQGFWVSLLVYLAWLWQPTWTLYGLAAPALSSAVGIAARNLDP